jgi:hypothetical protein
MLHRLVGWSAASAVAVGALLAASACGEAPPANPPPSLSASPTTSVAAAPAGGAANGQPGGGVQTGPAARPGAEPALCNSATLSVTLGPSEGAAGTVYAPLRFTNRGGRSCVIQGFPGVSYVTGDRGDQVGPAAQRDGAPAGPVTLRPGDVAFATLAMVQVRNYDPTVCRPTPVRGLRVYPPTDTTSVIVPLTDATGCAGNPPGRQLRISSVKPGAGPG